MRFKKFGKAFLMSALSAGVIFGLTSCVQSYTVGFLYVTGTNSATTSGNNGIISGFKIDHNKGKLTRINGLPISSGGSNPVRAVLLTGSQFVYVLNRGLTASGTTNCTTEDPCQGSNISLFAVGGAGVLSPQGTAYFSQGKNPSRIFTDSSGSYLYVLDQDSPDNFATSYNPLTNGCTLALGDGVKTCGEITAFKIDPTTGRLSLVLNTQVSSANGAQLSYFPVPANPIDVTLATSTVLTLSHETASNSDSVFPYTYNSASGQLTVNTNGSQSLGTHAATALLSAANYVWLLDNETTTDATTGLTAPSGVYIYTPGTGGTLSLLPGGVIAGDANLQNPLWLVVENKGSWAYVAYKGSNNTGSTTQESGIAGWTIDKTSHLLHPQLNNNTPFGTGSAPACMLEDPSHQFFYTANTSSSDVTGRSLDVQSGLLRDLPGNANKSYPLDGPATWCIVSGRTS